MRPADLDNCYFSDPAVNVLASLVTDNVTGLAEYNSVQHRKIRLYLELASGTDSNGHGTHTMGSLVGNCPGTAGTNAVDYRYMPCKVQSVPVSSLESLSYGHST